MGPQEPTGRRTWNHQLVVLWAALSFSKGRPEGDAGGKGSNLRGCGALLWREPAWGLRARKAWPAPKRQEESTNCGERSHQRSRVARKPANRPAPSGRRLSRAFFPGRRRVVTSPCRVFGAPHPPQPRSAHLVRSLVLLRSRLHIISYSRCLLVSRLKAHTQGPLLIPGIGSEEGIRLSVSACRGRHCHGQLHF